MQKLKQIIIAGCDGVAIHQVSEMLKKLEFEGPIKSYSNLDDLMGCFDDPDVKGPSLILLDMDGFEDDWPTFLEKRNKITKAKFTPIVLLASKADSQTVDKAFGLGIAGFFIKPPQIEKLHKICDSLRSYWEINELVS